MATKRIRHQTGKHHAVSVYAKQATEGKLHDMCCEYEILACQRHLKDLERSEGYSYEFPYVFDTTRADRLYRFFGQCIQVRGPQAGKPFTLESWQQFDIGCLYGWVEKDTGARRFNQSLNVRGRGQYKSSENSCKCLYHMTGDCYYPPYHPKEAIFESEPEVECAAVDRAQAMRVFGDARKIALASPSLEKRLYIPRSNPIVHRTRGGFMRALSSETKNKDSGAPSYFCVDEYESHPTSKIYDLGFNSFGKRTQALIDAIMTAGDDADNKPGKREEDYAKMVLKSMTVADRYFINIRELPEGADPHNEKNWLMPNPVLRYDSDYAKTMLAQIRTEHDTAYGSGDPDKIRAFLTRRMCQWQSASVNSYLSEEQIELARKSMISRGKFAELTDGLDAWYGFDLGKREDLSGVAGVFLLPDGRVAVKVHAFMPENGATRHEHSDKVPYIDWAKDNFCTLTPGDVTDNSYVWQWIQRDRSEHNHKMLEVDYDGHNATDLAIKIMEDEHREDAVVEIAQTCAGQNIAVKGFRSLLLEGRLVLEYSPLLLWCLKNAVEIVNNYGDCKISKKHKDDSQRIDPLAAAMDALARAMVKRAAPATLAQRIMQGRTCM